MIIPDLNELKDKFAGEAYIRAHFREFYNYILTKYGDIPFREKIYLFYNGLENVPVCPICGRNTKFIGRTKGYRQFCSKKCAYIGSIDKRKQTCLERYGVENPFQREDVVEKCRNSHTGESKEKQKKTFLERYGVEWCQQNQEVRKKTERTNLERYGLPYLIQRKDVVERCRNSHTDESKEKQKKTCLEKYGVEWCSQSKEFREKVKQTCLERYGVENPFQNDSIKEKCKKTCLERYGVSSPMKDRSIVLKGIQTKRINKSFNKSKLEEDCYRFLCALFGEVRRQYMSDKYPFRCDFYIPEKDLYIEIQGHWGHGLHAFDANNTEDVRKLQIWKEKSKEHPAFINAIHAWTVSDPLKRKTALLNNLNYIEAWSLQDLKDKCKLYKQEQFN